MDRDDEFQSPRSGQICSNFIRFLNDLEPYIGFNPLDRVKFVQIRYVHLLGVPKSRRFNPLDRVKFVQIMVEKLGKGFFERLSFNPLDRVKFVQIA